MSRRARRKKNIVSYASPRAQWQALLYPILSHSQLILGGYHLHQLPSTAIFHLSNLLGFFFEPDLHQPINGFSSFFSLLLIMLLLLLLSKKQKKSKKIKIIKSINYVFLFNDQCTIYTVHRVIVVVQCYPMYFAIDILLHVL